MCASLAYLVAACLAVFLLFKKTRSSKNYKPLVCLFHTYGVVLLPSRRHFFFPFFTCQWQSGGLENSRELDARARTQTAGRSGSADLTPLSKHETRFQTRENFFAGGKKCSRERTRRSDWTAQRQGKRINDERVPELCFVPNLRCNWKHSE